MLWIYIKETYFRACGGRSNDFWLSGWSFLNVEYYTAGYAALRVFPYIGRPYLCSRSQKSLLKSYRRIQDEPNSLQAHLRSSHVSQPLVPFLFLFVMSLFRACSPRYGKMPSSFPRFDLLTLILPPTLWTLIETVEIEQADVFSAGANSFCWPLCSTNLFSPSSCHINRNNTA